MLSEMQRGLNGGQMYLKSNTMLGICMAVHVYNGCSHIFSGFCHRKGYNYTSNVKKVKLQFMNCLPITVLW